MIYLASNGAGSISFLRPVTDPDLSWHKATNGVIALLTSHRYRSFSPTKLETHAGHAQQSVRHAMDVLSTKHVSRRISELVPSTLGLGVIIQ